MKANLFFAAVLLIANWSKGQAVQLSLDLDKGCTYYGEEEMNGQMYAFTRSRVLENQIQLILDQVGRTANFEIMSADVPNVIAQVHNGKRYILYGQQFEESIQQKSDDYWARMAILAHAVGHHLYGHNLDIGGRRHDLELQADEFSGSVLYKLGATLYQAQSALRVSHYNEGNSTHPPRNLRFDSITMGYNRAQELNPEPASLRLTHQESELSTYPDEVFSVTLGGQTYKAKSINGLTWMVQNLNYEVPESWCYQDNPANCESYGRLYTWQAAQEACASIGWRLPSDAEWQAMVTPFGGAFDGQPDAGKSAYLALIEGGPSGFSANHGGGRSRDGGFHHFGIWGHYWSATEYNSDHAKAYTFGGYFGRLFRNSHPKFLGFSCRCVRD